MDWKLCLICQEASNEGLKCPLNALGSGDMSAPYESFLSRVSIFKEFDRFISSLQQILSHLMSMRIESSYHTF